MKTRRSGAGRFWRVCLCSSRSQSASGDEDKEEDLGMDFGGFASAPADPKAPAADEDKEEDLGLDDFGGFASAPADPKAPAADEDKRRIWGWTILEGLPLLQQIPSASSG